MVYMQTQDFEDAAVQIAESFGGCYISARFVETEDQILTCGLFSSVTHELLASISE